MRDFGSVLRLMLLELGCRCVVDGVERLNAKLNRRMYSRHHDREVSPLLFPSIPVARTNQSLLEAIAFLSLCIGWVVLQHAGDLTQHVMLCLLLVWPNVQETVDEGLVYPRWTDDASSNDVVLTNPPR